jgi:hypothetical protein
VQQRNHQRAKTSCLASNSLIGRGLEPSMSLSKTRPLDHTANSRETFRLVIQPTHIIQHDSCNTNDSAPPFPPCRRPSAKCQHGKAFCCLVPGLFRTYPLPTPFIGILCRPQQSTQPHSKIRPVSPHDNRLQMPQVAQTLSSQNKPKCTQYTKQTPMKVNTAPMKQTTPKEHIKRLPPLKA